eukprot:800487-Pyramimonas_sp.AAC.1
MFAQTSHPSTRNLFCKTHAVTTGAANWNLLPCRRSGARPLTRRSASWFVTCDAAAMALTDGNFPTRHKGRAGAGLVQH